MPPTSAEVVVFDEEALSARSTAAALCNARKHGLCFCMPSPDGNTWWITPAGYELRTAVEDRFLRDTERDHAAT